MYLSALLFLALWLTCMKYTSGTFSVLFCLVGPMGSPRKRSDSREEGVVGVLSPQNSPCRVTSIRGHGSTKAVSLCKSCLQDLVCILISLQTFVGKVMSLLFNMLSRLVKHLLISWLQSPSSVILEPKKIKSLTLSIVSPSICHEVMGPNAMILVFLMWSFKPTFSLSTFAVSQHEELRPWQRS